MRKNADGSVDIYFSSKVPAGQESNWIYTPGGEKVVPVVSILWPAKAALRHQSEDAGH
jgi:hypothetical protein